MSRPYASTPAEGLGREWCRGRIKHYPVGPRHAVAVWLRRWHGEADATCRVPTQARLPGPWSGVVPTSNKTPSRRATARRGRLASTLARRGGRDMSRPYASTSAGDLGREWYRHRMPLDRPGASMPQLRSTIRSSFGTLKTIFSSLPASSSAPVAPWACRCSITWRTSTSGADAPAVTPILPTPCNQAA